MMTSGTIVWLLFAAPPVTMATIRPAHSPWSRLLRVIFAFSFVYVGMNVALHLFHNENHLEYEACMEEKSYLPIPQPETYEMCKHHTHLSDGAANVFYILIGWFPAGLYTFFWYGVWRLLYRKKARNDDHTLSYRLIKWCFYGSYALGSSLLLLFALLVIMHRLFDTPIPQIQ